MDPTGYDVLNVVALKKMASAPAVADPGLVVVAGGAALPTDAAEPALKAAAGQRYAKLRADADVLAQVERFETVNSQFLKTISAWQQVDVGGRAVANDHADAEYDDKIIGRIDKLVSRLDPLIDALAVHDARFTGYGRRFTTAMGEVDSGRHDYVSSPTLNSVHTVWFEFHEDLLRTLGRDRTE
jgi:hypothetical protein